MHQPTTSDSPQQHIDKGCESSDAFTNRCHTHRDPGKSYSAWPMGVAGPCEAKKRAQAALATRG
jgi:hypothetical protein